MSTLEATVSMLEAMPENAMKGALNELDKQHGFL